MQQVADALSAALEHPAHQAGSLDYLACHLPGVLRRQPDHDRIPGQGARLPFSYSSKLLSDSARTLFVGAKSYRKFPIIDSLDCLVSHIRDKENLIPCSLDNNGMFASPYKFHCAT